MTPRDLVERIRLAPRTAKRVPRLTDHQKAARFARAEARAASHPQRRAKGHDHDGRFI